MEERGHRFGPLPTLAHTTEASGVPCVHTPARTLVRFPVRTAPAPDRGTRSAADRNHVLPVRGCCGTAPYLALGRAPGNTDLVPVRGPALDPSPAGTPASEEANVCCAVLCGSSVACELDWHSAWGSLCWSA